MQRIIIMSVIAGAFGFVGWATWDGSLFCPGTIMPTPSLALFAMGFIFAWHGAFPMRPTANLLEFSWLLLVVTCIAILLSALGVWEWLGVQLQSCIR